MVDYHSLDPDDPASIDRHPYRERYQREWDLTADYGLEPTIYLLEALEYHKRAEILQRRNLGDLPIETRSGCPLQDSVAIYDTVDRWFAGFSNVSQELMLGPDNPKHDWNVKHGLDFWRHANAAKLDTTEQAYLLLVHRLCGSGASFAKLGDKKLPPHGWYNTPIPQACQDAAFGLPLSVYFRSRTEPMFSSIGNQVPPFNKPTMGYATGGRQFIVESADILAADTLRHLRARGEVSSIQDTVHWCLDWLTKRGFKRYKFVITAWVMDLAEYFPEYVDENSDCFHGSNAIESTKLVFRKKDKLPGQMFFDRSTRFYADVFGKRPMDIEDSVGCDIIRWVENFIIKRGYDDLDRDKVWNISYIRHPKGRQPWLA